MDGDGLRFSRSDLLSDLSTNDVLQSVLSCTVCLRIVSIRTFRSEINQHFKNIPITLPKAVWIS